MRSNRINIVYIDDINDEILSQYMNQEYCATPFKRSADIQIEKNYSEIRFQGVNGYEALFQDVVVKSANVILIDNHLFEEHTIGSGRFSGKQFKVILRKLLPYVEVIIVTQDETLPGENVVHKFSIRQESSPSRYYWKHLAPCLDSAIKEVLYFEDLAEDLTQSQDVEKCLIDEVLNSLQGDNSYDALSKEDIDTLIRAFKEIQADYECK